MPMKKLTLLQTLVKAENLAWSESLYLPLNLATWNESTEAIIENADNFEEYDESDNPVEMSNIGHKYFLSCDDVIAISSNLREKKQIPASKIYSTP
jgi:hypothetical protein